LRAIHAIHNAVCCRVEPADARVNEVFKAEAWAIIEERYRQDWPKHDGSFFSKMSKAMEVHLRANDPCATCVASEIIQRESSGLPLPTVKKMHAIAMAAGVQTTPKTIGRAFRYWGRKPSPDQRGGNRHSKRQS
jgi:hypothetical protein